MNQKQIDHLIVKFIENDISHQELLDLKAWLNNANNKAYFDEYIRVNYLINLKTPFSRESSLDEIKMVIATNSRVKKVRFIKYGAIAASIALLISLTFIFNSNNSQVEESIIVNNQIKTGTDKAILTMETGEEVALAKGVSFQTQNATSNGEGIVYNNNSSQQLVYNYLTIPRGGKFFIELSDGTKVWLNSESKFKYPVSFIDGEAREVELVYGEAYFDVSSSINHNGSAFRVINETQEVQVLGTEFNIKAYKDDYQILTTLVEGKVALNIKNDVKVLAPSEQANFNKLNETIEISKVDIYNEVSWKEGIFSFKDKPLKDIMTILSRWYDFNVLFENKDMEKDLFGGVFSKDQNIKDILKMIENSNAAVRFEVSEKTVTVK
ncbi:FecR family protein [Hyunsoonleella pacifica]|uniref:FecR family protein n=1 Tax=Hyunsoonleella pacifica TaxID=1080224 RepID=A0A4V2JB00_9FLAO|nr:FecR family protein [Hyunsoonleella pacifica]TBN16283.1 FecR family protein [Hyunsoonleella pacifica]GGD20760.1 iron dicitrate transporter FecR [Hyunsoonleella pacifica]